MNLKEKWNKQNNSIKLLLKKLKRHDTVVVATAVVIATALCGGLIYLSTPVVTANARDEIIQDELVNNEKTVEKLDELKEYLNGIDKTVAENQKNINSIHEKNSASSKETNELTKELTNNITEKVVGLDKDMAELRRLISSTEASIDSLKASMEKGDSDNAKKLAESLRNLYAQLQDIENKYSASQEKNIELINEVKAFISGGNKNMSKELQAQYNELQAQYSELLAKLIETDKNLSNQNNTSLSDYKNEINIISNTLDKKLAEYKASLTDELADVKDGISAVKDGVSAVNGEVSAVKGEVSVVKDGVSAVSGGVTDVKGSVSDVKGGVSDVKNGVSAVKGEVTNVKGEVSAVKEEVSTVKGNLDDLNRNLESKLGDAAGSLQVDLQSLKKYIGEEVGGVGRKLDKVFQSVSDGKRLLASALLTKGVEVKEDATFAQLAKAILDIKTEYSWDDIPGEVVYTYHYHKDGQGTECNDSMVDESRQGGCYNKAVNHVHTDDCYEVKTKYYYVTNYLVEQRNQVTGEYDAGGRQFYWYYCPYCGTLTKGTNSSHTETTYDRNVVKGRKGTITKFVDEKNKICAYEENELEGYITDCGYVHGQVMGAKITFPGKYSDYDTSTENGKGSTEPAVTTTNVTLNSVIQTDEVIEFSNEEEEEEYEYEDAGEHEAAEDIVIEEDTPAAENPEGAEGGE